MAPWILLMDYFFNCKIHGKTYILLYYMMSHFNLFMWDRPSAMSIIILFYADHSISFISLFIIKEWSANIIKLKFAMWSLVENE